MAILPFPFGALNTALSLILMHGISVTMFRSFLNQTLPTMQATSNGDKYQITLSKPTAKISNFIPEEIKFIQQQLNGRNRNIMDMRNQSIQAMQNSQPAAQSSSLQQNQNPVASSSNIIQQISQFRQQPFSGTISLHNNQGNRNTLSELSNQLNSNNNLNRQNLLTNSIVNSIASSIINPNSNPTNDNQLTNSQVPANPIANNQMTNTQSQYISSLNLPFTSAGLNSPVPNQQPNQQPKIVHIHHHDIQAPSASNDQNSYQHLNAFESSIQPGSLISFTALSKRKGLVHNEPVVKELPLNKITKILERKKMKELKSKKVNPVRIVCTYLFDEFTTEVLNPKLIEDANFCTHLNIHSLIIKKTNYQVGFEDYYQDTMRLNELIKIKNSNKDLKFILTIGNEADIELYDNLCSSSLYTSQFIESIVDLVQLYELDGVNFNLKFDSVPDSNLSFLFKQNLMQMLRLFRDELNRMGKFNFIVSAILPNSPDTLNAYFDLKQLNGLLDFVNVIGYEFYDYDKDNPVAEHHSSLYSSKNDNLEWLIKSWLNTDLEKNKLNIGLSTFGRTYNSVYNNIRTLNAPLVGLGINNGTISYGKVCRFLLKNETTYVYNENHQVPYGYNGYDLVLFENQKSLSVKSKYISKLRIGGLMLFALNYDDTTSECTIGDKLDDEQNRFPLHKVVFKTMELASFVNFRKKLDKRR